MHVAAKKRFRNSRLGNGLSVICGDISFGFRPVVAVPCVLVHRVEGHAAGLYGSHPGAHDVPWDIKSASLEKFFPPWTVQRQIWTDALKPCHLGVSTDVLLFSDINLSLGIITESSSEGCHILHFGRTTSHVCGCSCHRQRTWHSVIWRFRFRPARFQHAMLAPLRWSLSHLGRPDVPVAVCGLLVFVMNLSGSSLRP